MRHPEENNTMKTIKVRTNTNEWTNTAYYMNAIIVDELPEIGDTDYSKYNLHSDEFVAKIEEAYIDCEQGSEDVWDYDYYWMTVLEAVKAAEMLSNGYGEYIQYDACRKKLLAIENGEEQDD